MHKVAKEPPLEDATVKDPCGELGTGLAARQICSIVTHKNMDRQCRVKRRWRWGRRKGGLRRRGRGDHSCLIIQGRWGARLKGNLFGSHHLIYLHVPTLPDFPTPSTIQVHLCRYCDSSGFNSSCYGPHIPTQVLDVGISGTLVVCKGVRGGLAYVPHGEDFGSRHGNV
jgi:hypothetical protein